MKANDIDQIVLGAVVVHGPVSCKNLAEITGIPREQVYRSLYKLCKAKHVKNLKYDQRQASFFSSPGQYVVTLPSPGAKRG